MFSIYTLISLILGCIIGAVLARVLSPQQQKSRSLETQLQKAQNDLTQYEQEVTEHFAHTAKLVNSLTKSYKEVHEHLASDALKLANVDISRQLLKDSNDGDSLLGKSTISEESFQPPRDWAPKTPGTEGTLSEGFGLSENDGDEYTAADTPKTS